MRQKVSMLETPDSRHCPEKRYIAVLLLFCHVRTHVMLLYVHSVPFPLSHAFPSPQSSTCLLYIRNEIWVTAHFKRQLVVALCLHILILYAVLAYHWSWLLMMFLINPMVVCLGTILYNGSLMDCPTSCQPKINACIK